jgi:hypothetical protein
MAGNTTPHAIIAQGNDYATVAVPSGGSLITTTLTDAGSGKVASTQTAYHPASLSTLQMQTARQLFLGYANGQVAVSYNGGASWTVSNLGGGGITALAAGETAASGYPHAYAGTADGHLWAYTETQGAAPGGSWTQVGAYGSAVRALTYPLGGQGRAWIALADGTLGIYLPSVGTRMVLGTLDSPAGALRHLDNPTIALGFSPAAGVGLFTALEQSVGATVLSHDSTRTYTALATAGAQSVLACAGSAILWSPDALASLGTRTAPGLSGPYLACALAPHDHNEWAVGSAAGIATTLSHGSSYTVSTAITNVTALLYDRDHPGVLYALAGGSFCVSYDNGASWDALAPVASTAQALAQGSLMMA